MPPTCSMLLHIFYVLMPLQHLSRTSHAPQILYGNTMIVFHVVLYLAIPLHLFVSNKYFSQLHLILFIGHVLTLVKDNTTFHVCMWWRNEGLKQIHCVGLTPLKDTLTPKEDWLYMTNIFEGQPNTIATWMYQIYTFEGQPNTIVKWMCTFYTFGIT